MDDVQGGYAMHVVSFDSPMNERPCRERPSMGDCPFDAGKAQRRRRPCPTALAIVLAALFTSVRGAAHADMGAEETDTSIHAMRGIHQLELAVPLPEDTWAIGTGGTFFSADNLAIEGEHHRRLRWRTALAFSPWKPLDLGLAWLVTSDSSSPVLSTSTQTTGDPEVTAKLALPVRSNLSLGALARVLVPTSAGGAGLAFNATTITGQALATYQPARAVTLTLGVGYRFDNTRKIFSSSFAKGEETLMRFDGTIALTSSVVGGLGVIGYFQPSHWLRAAPFAELAVAMAPGGAFKDNPIAANLGAKGLFREGLIEVAGGASLRLAGAPSPTSQLPGLPPWEAFAQLTFHLGGGATPAPTVPSCNDQSSCRDHFACVDGACLPVHEVTKEVIKEVIREVVKAPPTFVISGVVLDAVTLAEISGATVRVSGFDNITLSSDDKGTFVSWPIAVDDGLVRLSVSAPGYRPLQQNLAKGSAGETRILTLGLMPADRKVGGQVQGSLKDKGSGMPVVGILSISKMKMKIRTKDDGTFAVDLPAGLHRLVITAPNVIPQEKQIMINPGEVVILNIDMTPQRK